MPGKHLMASKPVPSNEPLPRLHVLTDDSVLARRDFEQQARALLSLESRFAVLAGRPMPAWTLHLRGPRTSTARLYSLAESWSGAGWKERVTINDRVDIASALKLPAVHLGQRSLGPAESRVMLAAGVRVGVSVHDRYEARSARQERADYLMAGHVFSTPSHDAEPRGLALIVELCRASTPVIAVGGISPARVGVLLRAGAHGVAILRGIWDAPDPASALSHYLLRLPHTPLDVPQRDPHHPRERT